MNGAFISNPECKSIDERVSTESDTVRKRKGFILEFRLQGQREKAFPPKTSGNRLGLVETTERHRGNQRERESAKSTQKVSRNTCKLTKSIRICNVLFQFQIVNGHRKWGTF